MTVESIQIASGLLIGIVAIVSLWISVKSLKKADWNSAMDTVPSIILRPQDIWIGTRKKGYEVHSIHDSNYIIKKEKGLLEIALHIDFECFNVGRGVAFNISHPKSEGIPIIYNRVPLYQTLNEDSFRIVLQLSKRFDEWVKIANKGIAIKLTITYTNDQNNVYCKSCWSANIKPLKKVKEGLKVKETRLSKVESKIEYSPKPHES